MSAPPPGGERRPAGRYEWEQIIRRARLTGVIAAKVGRNGKAARGAISGMTFKAVALAFASYGNDKGAEIWPGDATVAVDLETTLKVVRDVKAHLVKLGLVERVRGRWRERGEEYRLTLPADLLDLVEVLTPAQHKLAAQRLRDAARGKPGGSTGSPETDSVGGPVDHPADGSGGPQDTPNAPAPPTPGWSTGPPDDGSGWSTGPASGGPVDSHTDHDRTTTTTDHSGTDLRTAVAVARARGHPNPESMVGDQECAHGVPPRIRCPACARKLPDVLPGDWSQRDTEAAHARDRVNRNAWRLRQRAAPAAATGNGLADVVPLHAADRERPTG